MASKWKPLKNTNDFIIGIALLLLGVYVITTDDIVHGIIPAFVVVSHPLVMPDVYVRMIGGFLTFLAAVLTIKSVNFTRSQNTKGFRFVASREAVITAAALVVYTFVLPRLGFFVSTFILIFSLTCVYLRSEKSGDGKPPHTKGEIVKDLIIVFVYTVLLVLFVHTIFTRVLFVNLP